MRIDLGAKVRTTDGHRAGHIKKAIWDPRANRVLGYVIGTGGLLGHEVVVSPEVLEAALRDGDEIALGLTKQELSELARYEESEYSASPAEWVAPTVYAFPAAGFVWPIRDADVAPPLVPPPSPTERAHRPEIRKGMRVRDAKGEDIGSVDEVKVDEATGDLRGIVVRRGGALERETGGGQTFEIDAEQVRQVDHDELRLVSSGAEVLGRQHA
jgi:sporulation protein YlmC with PRC-barrel domain